MPTYRADVSRERARFRNRRGGQIDLVTRRLRGELVEVATVEMAWCRLAATFPLAVLAMPPKLAPLLVGQDAGAMRARLRTRCARRSRSSRTMGFFHAAAGVASIPDPMDL